MYIPTNLQRQEAKKIGVTDSTSFLQESPYIFGDSDHVQHSQQESLRLFLQKNKYFQSEPYLLASAINQTFGRELINEEPALPTPASSEPSTAHSVCLGQQRRHLFSSMYIHTTGIDRRPRRLE